MTEIQVTIRRVALPDGPRGTMARLRGEGRFALLESALPMLRQAQWSYIAGPALATLYTDEGSTWLEKDGCVIASWADPFEHSRRSPRGSPTASASKVTAPRAWTSLVAGWACWATTSRAMSSA